MLTQGIEKAYRELAAELLREFPEEKGFRHIAEYHYDERWETYRVSYVIEHRGGFALRLHRSFSPDPATGEVVLSNILMRIRKEYQGRHLSSRINLAGVRALESLGGSRIEVDAELDDGALAWLRSGFWPNEGKDKLDEIFRQTLPAGDRRLERWLALTEPEARAFVHTQEFKDDYKAALFGQAWSGSADIRDPETRWWLTREGEPPWAPKKTINEAYRDAAIARQVDVRRYSAGVSKKINTLLAEADRDLSDLLAARLARFEGKPIDYTGARWGALLEELRAARQKVLAQIADQVTPELEQLAATEAGAELGALSDSIGLNISFSAVPLDKLKAIATSRPFQGRLLKDWFQGLESLDRARLQQAVQLGMVNGEPIDDIVRRVVGTRANNYADGVLSMTRRDATAVVRTAVNHVSNAARNEVWEANSDIIQAKVWTSTLDGRTSPICRARDGHGAPVGDNSLPADIPPLSPPDVQPPAHVNCRSVMVAVIDGLGLLGDRPAVTDTRGRKAREVDFRRLAKEQGKTIQEVRADWAARNVGRVPATLRYEEWLRGQSPGLQDEILGRSKGRLFRQGGLSLEGFVDRAGNELTLAQLSDRVPEAFRAAGIDPGQF
jgi:SPP1 gp7 family putative phage head morphogenesis protein